MKIINEDIKEKKYKRVYLLCGEEEYLKKNYKNKLIKAISGDDTMNTNFYEGKGINIKSVIDIAETMPFLSEYRLIVMEDTNLFKSGGEELAEYVENIPDSTIILFSEKEVDKRSKLYKQVKKQGYVCELGRQDEKSLGVWAAKILASAGKNITSSNMNYLLAKVGTDMQLLAGELEKLIAYCINKNVVEKEDIDAVCTTQLSVKIFDMIDAIAGKNQKKALDIYYDLLSAKEPPARILYLITRQFNLMLQAKDMSNHNVEREQMAKTMGVLEFVVRKTINQGKNFTIPELKSAFRECVKTDEEIKKGEINDKIGVEMLLIKYSYKNNSQ